ncbi:hypothetical protein [Flavivirga jejuensis]|uniref:Heme oxygenase n=1 Tax=Flavivirga jejuensis TaxID=870487 RepID=A0ABT8WIG1_9FLAO|nr:hypothetical protein [Flavivirga jejuensis]MDO5972910.1 hypothetical protein [Flavivirga jejuensis]
MENTFRKKLYTSTKELHNALEHIFKFNDGINEEKLDLFYNTMLIARYYCKPLLENLATCHVNTYNEHLINALKKDLKLIDYSITNEVEKYRYCNFKSINFSTQLGAYYVFAGSAAGAKVLLASAKKQTIIKPFYYFTALANSSQEQMNSLKELLSKREFIESEVIESAQNTFNLIYQIATNELQKRNTKLQGIRS